MAIGADEGADEVASEVDEGFGDGADDCNIQLTNLINY